MFVKSKGVYIWKLSENEMKLMFKSIKSHFKSLPKKSPNSSFKTRLKGIFEDIIIRS